MRIKSLPTTERPIEKALEKGIGSLSNSEILALIIHTGTREKSAISLAEEVLSMYDTGISALGGCSLDELTLIPGIGNAKGCTILAAIELGKRIATSKSIDKISIESSSDVASLFMEELRYEKKEHFRTVLVNSKGDIIGIDNVSVGELSSTVVHPREVFNKAVRKSAAGIIFVHNHPSGDPTPSQEDVDTTRRLVEGGKLLGIRVLDHIVIGDGQFKSLRSMKIVE